MGISPNILLVTCMDAACLARTASEAIKERGAKRIAIHHVWIKALGQTLCRHDAPDCAICPLRDLCPGAGR